MKNKLICFTINTLEEAERVILGSKTYKIKPILHLKKYFLLGFGAEFILTFQKMLISKFGKLNFELFGIVVLIRALLSIWQIKKLTI